MKALILCAGLGTRLRPITDKMPKCMVEVGGKPVLEHLVDHLNKYGITEIIVNLHWKPEVVYKYFGTRLLYFYEPELLGEVKTEIELREWLGDDYFVMNGDTLTDINLGRLSRVCGSVASLDNGIYTGTKHILAMGPILPVEFHCYWQDIGTPEGLAKAREHYEKKARHLSKL